MLMLFSSSVVSDSLLFHWVLQARPPCPSQLCIFYPKLFLLWKTYMEDLSLLQFIFRILHNSHPALGITMRPLPHVLYLAYVAVIYGLEFRFPKHNPSMAICDTCHLPPDRYYVYMGKCVFIWEVDIWITLCGSEAVSHDIAPFLDLSTQVILLNAGWLSLTAR